MQEAKSLFRKLKIISLLDLALLTPSSYIDFTLSRELKVGEVQTFEAIVKEVSTLNGRLHVTFILPKINQELDSIFFKVTSYHYNLFQVGTHHYIQGRVSIFRGKLQMSQPKSIKEVGKIIPKYSTSIKQSDMRALVGYFIRESNLYREGLSQREVVAIMRLHYPKSQRDIEKIDIDALKFVEAFNHMKKLRGKRKDFPAIEALRGNIDSFLSNLPFSLTPEQEYVIAQIKKDLSQNKKATKRMVIGDVGSGKTMVILASAMIAYPKKSILMAPTSLLAIQIYQEAIKYLPDNIKVALITQNRQERDYLESDFIIGTHALLYKDDIPKAPLVMIDEQHRFGTRQRAMLEKMVSQEEKKPHFLQFSATPIPRTQAMIESELIDVSLITSTPFKKDITTKIIGKEDFGKLLSNIKMEIAQNHQVLIVYPLVEESKEIPYQSIDEGRGFWEDRFERVFVTHGKDKNKDEVLLEFRDRGNILLATTVVEVGISLPRLTIVVIVGAERLGLATLHQLRGRVGRLGLKSWCYLFSNNKENGRLEAFSRTTSGFEIAKLDLKFRKSGDILDGTIQSGLQFKWLDLAEDEEIIRIAKERLSINNKTTISLN